MGQFSQMPFVPHGNHFKWVTDSTCSSGTTGSSRSTSTYKQFKNIQFYVASDCQGRDEQSMRLSECAVRYSCMTASARSQSEQTQRENWRPLQSRYKNRLNRNSFISAVSPPYKTFSIVSLNVLRAYAPNTLMNYVKSPEHRLDLFDDQPTSVKS